MIKIPRTISRISFQQNYNCPFSFHDYAIHLRKKDITQENAKTKTKFFKQLSKNLSNTHLTIKQPFLNINK